MTPLALAATWLGAAAVVAALAAVRRRALLAWVAPAAAALATLAVAPAALWPGPASSPSYGATLSLGRPGVGLLIAGGVAMAATLALSARLDGGEVVTCCIAGASATVVLSATVPIVWGLAIAVCVGALAVRWISAAPGVATLAAGRIAGVGAATVLGASAFIPYGGAAVDTRTALAGGLLAGGVSAVVALLPLGGWAAGTAAAVRGADLAPWALLLAPAVLVSCSVLLPSLPTGARNPFANVLLDLGLVSALFGSLQALRATPAQRYGRVLIADLALVATGLGTTHAPGRTGGLVLVLCHVVAGPLLLQGPRAGLERQRRLAWLAVSGLPPTPAFWGRFLVLQGCAATNGNALVVGMVAGAALLAASLRSVIAPGRTDTVLPAARGARALAWLVALGAIGAGFAPDAMIRGVFGAG